MKAKLILLPILLILISPAKSFSQKKFEIELGFSTSIATRQLVQYEHRVKPGFTMDFRYNYKNLPASIGLKFEFLDFDNVWHGDGSALKTYTITLTNDYSFRPGKKIDPYLGVGFGMLCHKDDTHAEEKGVYFTVIPRAGIRFLNFMNLSVSKPLISTGYRFVNVSLGFYLGF